MLTIHGNSHTLCDGIPRRSFLKIGAFAFGATQFTLADVLRRSKASAHHRTRPSSTFSLAAVRRIRTCGT